MEIPKASGGKRPLGIPTVADRTIQQGILLVLGPMWDPGFSESSFGFRPGRNAHGAVKQVQRLIRTGRRWAVDIDLRKFFDTVDHRIVMSRLARKLEGQPLLRLIGCGRHGGRTCRTRAGGGVPRGGSLSPLPANIVLDDLDRMLDQRGHAFARYADDFRNLRALGVPIRPAVGPGRSSLGPWKCARLLGFAMSKSWLEKQGLICLADDWWRCAPIR